jgi:hypothetical protein
VDKFFKTLARLASSSEIRLAKSENKLAQNVGTNIEKWENPHHAGDWVFIFTHQV